MFPQAIALAATFDEELIEKIGDVVSTEGRAKFEAYSGRGDRGIYKGLTFWARICDFQRSTLGERT